MYADHTLQLRTTCSLLSAALQQQDATGCLLVWIITLQSEPSKAHIKSPTQNLATNNTVVDTKKQTQLQQLSRVRSCRKLRGIFLFGFQRQFPP